MRLFIKIFCISFFVSFCAPLFAQTHTSVPLNSQIYFILEQAEARGLCAPLSGVRPYTQDIVNTAIREILYSENADKLRAAEREILEQYLVKHSMPKSGIDWKRGAYYGETAVGSKGVPLSLNMGLSADIEGSAGFYLPAEDKYFGTETWAQVYLNGDLGKYVSYNFSVEGGLMLTPRRKLGEYWSYYEGFQHKDGDASEYQNREITVYSEPLTHFPYSYRKRWDGSIYFLGGNLASYESWPEKIAGSYNILSEMNASFMENKLLVRLGRLPREWGSVPFGSSMAFNQAARPFIGLETEFNPVPWFGIASMTGALEYYNIYGIKESAMTFQNAFSITMFQLRFKNYIYFDFVDAVVYPKRLELGYISPITNSFFYQNNIGDFDNMAMSANLKLQYPGIGNVWVTLFVDEMNLLSDMLTLDRQMIAAQAGTSFPLPFLSFSSIKFSYTAVNPYCYTHNRNRNPWHGDLLMETAYVNNGVSIGYYLPPNSDEFLVRLNTMPATTLSTHLQYQMIRHGADFGPSAVDGSNLRSELDPNRGNNNPVLRRYFLHDGAYQWMHIVRLGGEWTPEKAPFAISFEAGTVISYFTNTKEPANSGKAHPYSIIDTADYPKSTGFIAKLGFRLFPR
jgi:hypothetical protein